MKRTARCAASLLASTVAALIVAAGAVAQESDPQDGTGWMQRTNTPRTVQSGTRLTLPRAV